MQYEGIVTSFSTTTKWGFIACPLLSANVEGKKDIFFHMKDCDQPVSKGQTVYFLLDEHSVTSGKPQARRIIGAAIAADPIGANRLTGSVISYSEASAWGFITCPEVSQVYHKDVFFHLKDCGGSPISKGQTVSFILDEDAAKGGKPQARSVQVLGGSSLSHSVYRGSIVGFSPNTAWGFINCPDLVGTFGKDIFFHQKNVHGGAGAATKGATVTFVLDEQTENGKPQARDIRVDGASITGGGNSGGCNSGCSGCGSSGGFGCGGGGGCSSSGCRGAYGCGGGGFGGGRGGGFGSSDGGCGSSGGGTAAGDAIQQLLAAVQTLVSGNRSPTAATLPKAPAHRPTSSASMGFGSGGGDLMGTIQSFSGQAGWGFIECPALGHASGKGIFFHVKDCRGMSDAAPPVAGQAVTFSLGRGSNGKEQAVNVSAAGGAGSPSSSFGASSFSAQKRSPATAGLNIDAQQLLAALTSLGNLANRSSGEGQMHSKRPRMG